MIFTAASIIPLLVDLAAGSNSAGRTIVQQGSTSGAPACVACHGARLQGNAVIGAPALAGKPAAFVIARLEHYASPAGHNAMMKQVATSLSPSDREAVAAYIAGLKAPVVDPR
jgi:cytochrome c553